MASPQTENGFTRISNEIMEALCHIRISGEARQILDTIIRKTYGWNKKEDIISLSQFCLATGLSKSRVCHSLLKLAQMGLIAKKGNGMSITYRFNKDFDTWKALPKKESVAKKGNSYCQKRKKSLPIIGHTKDNKDIITKDTIQKTGLTQRKDITESVLIEIAQKYGKGNPHFLAFVQNEWNAVCMWEDEKPGRMRGRNWKMTLLNFIRRDAEKLRKEEYGKSKISLISADPDQKWGS